MRARKRTSPPSSTRPTRIAPLEVCIFNLGANVNFPMLETTERVFRKVWEMACYGGFLTGREAARLMLPRGTGTIFFTGATASLRGGIGYAAFASAKFGLRAVAQSMARELGPQNIHVAHLIIDAGVDTAFVRERIKARGGEAAVASIKPDQLMNPESIADAYWMLHTQTRDAWTFELDLRPYRGDLVMSANVEFLFDFGSPNAYLAHRVIPRDREAHRREVRLRAGPARRHLQGDQQPARRWSAFGGIKNKMEYEQLETAALHHAPRHHRLHSSIRSFPVNTLDADAHGGGGAERRASCAPMSTRCSITCGSEPKKMDDPEVIRAALHRIRPRCRAAAGARRRPRRSRQQLMREHGSTRWRAACSASRPSSSATRSSSARTGCAMSRKNAINAAEVPSLSTRKSRHDLRDFIMRHRRPEERAPHSPAALGRTPQKRLISLGIKRRWAEHQGAGSFDEFPHSFALRSPRLPLLCLSHLAAPRSAGRSPPRCSAPFKDWSAYTSGTRQFKVCYALSKPKSSEPKKAKRDPVYFLISDWPGPPKAKAEPEVVPGYLYKEDSTVTAQVGGDKFEILHQERWRRRRGLGSPARRRSAAVESR